MMESLAPEFWLFCEAMRAAPRPDEVRRLASEITSWGKVPASARRHRVIHRLLKALRSHAGGIVPAEILEKMRIQSLTDQAACHAQVIELQRISQAFSMAGIANLVLKGIPLSQELYGHPAARGIGDLDLLVDPAQLRQADMVLRDLGYVRQGAELLDRDQTICQKRIKDIAFRHEATGQMVELHQRLTENPYLLPCHFPSLWRSHEEVQLGGASIATLPRRDLVLYLCIHGASHCWQRLGWLVDLAELLRPLGMVGKALADAEAAGLGRPMREAVGLCHQWLGLPVASDHLPELGTLDPFISRFFSGNRWDPTVKPASLEWLRRYSFWARLHSWSLRRDFRYRAREVLGVLIWPPDWDTIPLPDALFWLYPFLRPVAWAMRRLRKTAS